MSPNSCDLARNAPVRAISTIVFRHPYHLSGARGAPAGVHAFPFNGRTTMKTICDIVYQACRWLVIVFGLFMLAVISVGIVSRYVIARPIIWEYEACIALFIWCTFLGAATAFRDKQHIAFGMLASALPTAPRKVVLTIKNLLVLGVLVFGAYAGHLVVDSTWYIEYQTIPFSLAFSYAALPIGFLASLLFVVEGIIRNGVSAE